MSEDVTFDPVTKSWGTVTGAFLDGVPIWLDEEVWKVDETLEEELDCRWCRYFYFDEAEVFAAGECTRGRRLRLRNDDHWWPLGTSGHPQPPRYCTMRKYGSN